MTGEERAHTTKEMIAMKSRGEEWSEMDIKNFIKNLVDKKIPDVQLGAFLMAVYLTKLYPNETTALTRAFVESGERLVWPDSWNKQLVVDKHSTGGVGDKVTLPLAPALAALGLILPTISGRGLGLTGGTLDKLESIPGFNVSLSLDEVKEAAETVGCCIVGQTEDICPADRIMYTARDTTSTVSSEGLIVASIIGKKACEGISSLVMDVKYGLGAVNSDLPTAEKLAVALAQNANSLGIKTSVVISHMNSPLGFAVGNSLEVIESIDCLKGKGPRELRELVCVQGGILLENSGLVNSREEGEKKIATVLDDGSALKKFGEMLNYQGVSPDVVGNLLYSENSSVLKKANHIKTIVSEKAGFLHYIDAEKIARLAARLGAGRDKPKDKVDHAVGIVFNKSPGDWVSKGEAWAEIHHNKPLHELDLADIRASLHLTEKNVAPKRITKVI